jgi:electron transfer flavoprotein beta subunit
LKIAVCVKPTPPSEVQATVENGKVIWGDSALIINPWDEYAVEAALQQKEIFGGTVMALSVGDESALIALKHALAMGVDDAVLISDPGAMLGADPEIVLDTQAVARLLAAGIQKLGGVDMACFGRQAIDGDSGIVPSQVARLLGWPSLTLTSTIKVDGNTIRVEKNIEEGRQIINAKLPVVISLTKDFGEPRYPSFLNKRKADRATIPVWSLMDLGIPAPTPVVAWMDVALPVASQTSCEFIAGNSPEEIAESLAEKILAEKIL